MANYDSSHTGAVIDAAVTKATPTTLGTSEASKCVTADASGDLIVPDSDKFKFGAGSDMQLYHDGSNSFIQQSGTGALKVATEDSGKAVSIGHTTSETTVNDNLTVTGNLSVTGTAPGVSGITSDGTDITITSGDIIIGTAGKGIDFSAQTPTSASGATTTAEVLDHYEEGTWTPVVTDGSNAMTMAGAYIGTYVKIGSQVTIITRVASTDKQSASGDLYISGLPFANPDNQRNIAAIAAGGAWGLAITANQSVSAIVRKGDSKLELMVWSATTGTANMNDGEWSDDGNVAFSGTYAIH